MWAAENIAFPCVSSSVNGFSDGGLLLAFYSQKVLITFNSATRVVAVNLSKRFNSLDYITTSVLSTVCVWGCSNQHHTFIWLRRCTAPRLHKTSISIASHLRRSFVSCLLDTFMSPWWWKCILSVITSRNSSDPCVCVYCVHCVLVSRWSLVLVKAPRTSPCMSRSELEMQFKRTVAKQRLDVPFKNRTETSCLMRRRLWRSQCVATIEVLWHFAFVSLSEDVVGNESQG